MQGSAQAANELNEGNILSRRLIPQDTSIPGNREFRYELGVTFTDPDHDPDDPESIDRSQTVYITYLSDSLQNRGELERTAPRNIIARMQRQQQTGIRGYAQPEGFQAFGVEISIRSVYRRQ